VAKQKPLYDIRELAAKWKDGTITPEEKTYYENWYKQFNDEVTELNDDQFSSSEELEQHLYRSIAHRLNIGKAAQTRRLWPRIAAAASILIAISVGSYFLLHHKQPVQQVAQNQTHDVAPGRNQATLTLANGQKIVISPKLNGQLATQGSTAIQANSGAIRYVAGVGGAEAVQYNTVTTARGEQLSQPLMLADGTRVWLDAASSITYPTAFNGSDREVTITGEVYFEAAHNAAKPFRVHAGGQTIEVLGTHFDVNSYADEPTLKTTLLEGRVKVTAANNQTAILLPGEQSIIGRQSIKIFKADIDITMAWKDGMFRFDGTPLSDIMNQVARWYNVDIIYQDEALKNVTFFAMSTRFANASQLLHNLEQTHEVKFKINGKQITVMNPN